MSKMSKLRTLLFGIGLLCTIGGWALVGSAELWPIIIFLIAIACKLPFVIYERGAQ